MSQKSLIVLAAFLFAQQGLGANAKALTWAECASLALQHNAELRLAKEALKLAELDQKAAKAERGPSISAFAEKSFRHDPSDPNDSSVLRTNRLGLSLDQNIYRGGGDNTKIAIAEKQVEIRKLELAAKSYEIVGRLKGAFARTQFSIKALTLAEHIKLRRIDNLKVVQLRYGSGLENKGSLALSQTNVEQADQDIQEIRHGYESSRDELLQLVGVPDAQLGEPGELQVNKAPQVAPDFVKIAQNHSLVRLAGLEESIAQLQVGSSEAKYLPSVQLQAGYGRWGQELDLHRPDWNVTLGVSINLYNSGRDSLAVESAIQKTVTARIKNDKIMIDKQTEMKSAFRLWQDASSRLKLMKDMIDATQLRSDIARTRYRNALIGFEEWYLIENELITLLKSRLDEEKETAVRQANWEQIAEQGILL